MGSVETGLITVAFGLLVGIIGFKLLKSWLIASIFNDTVEYMLEPTNKAQIKLAVEQEITEYAHTALEFIHKNPEALTPVLTGLIQDLAKAVPKEALGKIVSDTAGQMAGDVVGNGAVLQFVPRKWRGPVALLQMFMGSGAAEKKPETTGFG